MVEQVNRAAAYLKKSPVPVINIRTKIPGAKASL